MKRLAASFAVEFERTVFIGTAVLTAALAVFMRSWGGSVAVGVGGEAAAPPVLSRPVAEVLWRGDADGIDASMTNPFQVRVAVRSVPAPAAPAPAPAAPPVVAGDAVMGGDSEFRGGVRPAPVRATVHSVGYLGLTTTSTGRRAASVRWRRGAGVSASGLQFLERGQTFRGMRIEAFTEDALEVTDLRGIRHRIAFGDEKKLLLQ